MNTVKAVITGDIIASSSIPIEDKEFLILHLKKLLKDLDNRFKCKSELFRGDSFQSLVSESRHALRIALLIKMAVKSYHQKKTTLRNLQKTFDVRIAIGLGTIDLPMKKVVTSHGPAFELSGRLLDELKSKKISFGIASSDDFHLELNTESQLLDAIIAKCSPMQCQVIQLKLLNLTEQEIADQLQVGQSAVNQRASSGNWHVFRTMIERFETIYAHG